MSAMSKPATAEDFARWEEKAKAMTSAALDYSMKDAKKASEAVADHDPIKSNYYRDEMLTYSNEIDRRRRGTPCLRHGRLVKG
jgi:hypothetical protein